MLLTVIEANEVGAISQSFPSHSNESSLTFVPGPLVWNPSRLFLAQLTCVSDC